MQSNGLRVIDDFSESAVNAVLSSCETVCPSDLDMIGANARLHLDAFCLVDDARSEHSPFRGVGRRPEYESHVLLGRPLDLSKAYRQLARSPAHSSITVIAVPYPDSGWLCFEHLALAFGASSSVLSFNWVASALARILVVLLAVGGDPLLRRFHRV